MSLQLPWTLGSDDPAGPDLENRLRDNMDAIAQAFPVAGANIANDVLRLAVTGVARKVQFGTLAAVVSDASGWCNYTLPTAFATQIDVVLAQNNWQGANGDGFRNVSANPVNDPQHFRAFVTTPGLSCTCAYIAIGH